MYKYISLTGLFLCFFMGSEAQTFVQLEVFNSLTNVKYAPGQKIVFKTKQFPKEWRSEKVERIMYDENIIVFQQGIVDVEDITHVKTRNQVSYALSRVLYSFAVVSLIYGGIGDIVTQQLSPGLFLFTIPPAILGFFLDKVVTPKVYKLGSNSRLRLLDLRMN